MDVVHLFDNWLELAVLDAFHRLYYNQFVFNFLPFRDWRVCWRMMLLVAQQ